MEEGAQITEFGKIFLYLVIGTLLVLFTFFIGKLVSSRKPTKAKLSTYECGEEPQGSAWIQFNPRFYVIALIFLLFDVEIVFIFPWSTIFGAHDLIKADSRWGLYTLIEMFAFLSILIIGLIYVWMKGDLEWIKPHPTKPVSDSKIPFSAYERINQRQYPIRAYQTEEAIPKEQLQTSAVSKPAFKPRFIKKEQ